MYLYKSGRLPDSFNDMFLFNCDILSCKTRNNNSFHLPYSRTNGRKFLLLIQGPKRFNSLSCENQNASSIAVFTSKLKSFFLVYASSLLRSLFFFFVVWILFPTFSFLHLHLHCNSYLFCIPLVKLSCQSQYCIS